MIDTALNKAEVDAWRKLIGEDCAVFDFGVAGIHVTKNSETVFRATQLEPDVYYVRYCERSFPHV